MNLSEIAGELTKALAEAAKADETLQRAKAALAPLEEAAKEKHKAVNVLMGQYQNLTSDATPSRKRAIGGGPKRVYNSTPEAKVAAMHKRTLTRLTNQGVNKAEAEKKAKAAADALKKKLGAK